MAESYDAAITLSHKINPDGTLTDESRERVDRSVEMLFHGAMPNIVMAGGHNGRNNTSEPTTHAQAMKQYAVSKGVFAGKVYLEEDSVDTVGQLLFSKKQLVVPNNWGKLVVISHDYHAPRVMEISKIVFGDEFAIGFEFVRTNGSASDPQVIQRERTSLDAFLRTFAGVTPGKTEDLLARLYEAHPLYKGQA